MFNQVLEKTAAFCKDHDIPFPSADFASLEKEPQKEVYVFEDKENVKAPIVVHFPLVNVTYKHFKHPGMPILSGWISLQECCFYFFSYLAIYLFIR